MTNFSKTQTPQDHLPEERLATAALDGMALVTNEAAHLAICSDCQAVLATYQQLDHELLVAKLSQVSDAAQERYYALFETARVNATGLTERLTQFTDAIKASIMWNGQARLAADGVRSASSTSYRMLYGTELAEIELMIEPVGGQFKIEGEVLPLQDPSRLLPMWFELHKRNGPLSHSGESDSEGRFHIPAMETGAYSLYMVPQEGTAMLIDTLELA